MALTLGALLRKDVILEGLLMFISGGRALKTLRRAGMGFDFRHFLLLRYCCESGSDRLATGLLTRELVVIPRVPLWAPRPVPSFC
jgi:hypothetical protein